MPPNSCYPARAPVPSLPLILNAALPAIPALGTPLTPVSVSEWVPCTAPLLLPVPAPSAGRPEDHGYPSISPANLCHFHLPLHTLPLSQVQPTPYPTPNPEQERAEPPVKVNI